MLISPVLNLPFIQDADGNPLNGGRIYAYEGGSFSILAPTYADVDGDVENANPIVLTSSGSLPPGIMIWLEPGLAYNFTVCDENDVVLRTFENVQGVGSSGGGGGSSSSIWVEAPGATFLSANSFLVAGNLTAEFAVGNRVRLTQGAYTYGVVSAVSFSSPSTFVTIINDGAVLNPSLSLAEYSVLIASPGETVDAGGVSYFDAMPYSTANTVGWKLKETESALSVLSDFVDAQAEVIERSLVVHTASGSGVDAAYTVTMSPAVTSYSAESLFTIKFGGSTGNPTLNINGVGAAPLRQFDSSGALVAPNILAGLVSDVAYDGTNWIVLDPSPSTAGVIVPPSGAQAFTSNGTFTTPTDVYYLHVTCVGGGGGGGAGLSDMSNNYAGRGGGGGAVSQVWISTTPGTTYSVAIGSGGAGGTPMGNGTAGGTSSFGITICTAAGGAGATNFSEFAPFTPAAGGSSGTGLVFPGGTGSRGGAFLSGGAPGAGYDNFGGGSPGFSLGAGVGPGSGGNGADTGGPTGSAGNAGICLVTW